MGVKSNQQETKLTTLGDSKGDFTANLNSLTSNREFSCVVLVNGDETKGEKILFKLVVTLFFISITFEINIGSMLSKAV